MIDKPYWFNLKFTLGDTEDVVLKDLCDGYIVLDSLSLYQHITLIPDFINQSNFEQAKKRIPLPHSEFIKDDEKFTLKTCKRVLKMYTDSFNMVVSFFSE